ncbi:hypothetical protein NSA53_03775 [Cellulosimicrobium cellulans]|uniref:hypothetical protein n=1 Tax=Cellulosimicrobium cellulans TaxID=1710 RepID=UPI002149EE7D|nr:hypothetical protein [Cellulosimicrobium cellulans]
MHGDRYTGGVLDGFKEWLLTRPDARGPNLVWSAIVWGLAFPGPESPGLADLTDDDDRHALAVLFELVDTFLAEKEPRLRCGSEASGVP